MYIRTHYDYMKDTSLCFSTNAIAIYHKNVFKYLILKIYFSQKQID